ncbi:MAG: hemolysin family protein [Actinobacteria bacterium]|nr:hemolysin family protein [Actinomycetota bacterium]
MLGPLLAVLLVLINGFFVAGEFAIVAVERSKVEALAAEGDSRAASLLRALRTLSFQLSGAQLGITITSLLVGFLIEPALAPLFEPIVRFIGVPESSSLGVSVAVALVIATTVQMVAGELVPKNLAISRPEGVAFAIATPLRLANASMKPLIVFLNAAANWTVRLFGIQPQDELTAVHSLEELQVLIRSSREAGGLDEEEATLLARSISFGDKTAADALIPRVDIVSVSRDSTLHDLTGVALETGHSRFPVTGDGIDDIIGIAHVKDVHTIKKTRRATVSVTDIMRPPLVVPESRDLASLLVEMRRTRLHLAVVIDEFGGTAGIVTLEDLLEEIVGEIDDEYDASGDDAQLTSSPEGVHVVAGMSHPDELRELTGFEMPEGDYETLAGFLLDLFDRIPSNGDHISFDGWEFKIVEMEKRRIAQVLMVRAAQPRSEEEP